ncbi:hypothetical protein C3941_22590 [Kaistia algarum]|uniref:Lnb N-terminal periplasmic domain-containing protein n=1 Tax=Kaistia algarum TaxID=2083279 RepID=UPI000CE79894|nr:DUF4105 domain-containing protein [Kaistia algarum]MCX5513580.1 DUF4105 domain-containing protein [Kaistia algarum]PPE77647.1 hypothetical protein C3941_22590 [Kaistia algarum]
MSGGLLWIGRFLLRALLFLVVALSAVWIGFCLYFQLPLPDIAKSIAVLAWALFAVAILTLEIARPSWRVRGLYILAIIVFAAWWSTILPTNDRDWRPEVAHGVTGTVDGDIVTLSNVRDFDWRSDTDFTERWETRRYDLSKLATVDLVLGYWMGPQIAHTIISFGFTDGQHLSFSAEIRPDKTQEFSALAGFFRVFNLVLIAADERDVIYVRTNVRREDLYLYPIEMPQAGMRALFLSYVESGNALAARPKFYNTLTTNCTTVVFRLIRALDPGLPRDYRILLSGYLPDYVFEHQGYRTGLSREEFRARAAISALALAAGNTPGFSAAIRPPTGLAGALPVDKP